MATHRSTPPVSAVAASMRELAQPGSAELVKLVEAHWQPVIVLPAGQLTYVEAAAAPSTGTT